MTWQSDSRSFSLRRGFGTIYGICGPEKAFIFVKIRRMYSKVAVQLRFKLAPWTKKGNTAVKNILDFWIHFLRDFRFSVFFFSFKTLSTSFNRFWSFFSDEDEFVDESESEELEDELEELSRLRRFFDLLFCVFGRLRRLEDRDDLKIRVCR